LRQLERHAGRCADCAADLESWTEISTAAAALRSSWKSEELWRRIENDLRSPEVVSAGVRFDSPPFDESTDREYLLFEQGRRAAGDASTIVKFPAWLDSGLSRIAVAAMLILVIGAGSAFFMNRQLDTPGPDFDRWVLQESALQEVEKAELEHMASIDRLSKLVEPRLENAETPLMLSYREKLLLLDDAIAECRASVDENRQNTHLRRQLLAMYTEKDRTLREVMKESNDVSQ
jgi:hypothetical protein